MGKKPRVTLQDVANLAGVNPVTVSVALGRSPQGGTRVSEATRQRILEAASELSYTPNLLARALQGDRTHIVGYYAGYEMLDASSPFTAATLQGLQHQCRMHKQDLLLFGSFERDTVDSIYATLMSGKIDGLVVLPTPFSPVMDKLYQSPLPIVAIANAHPALPSVVVDDAAGSALLGRYLASKGHRRILYRHRTGGWTSVQRRRDAFQAVAEELNLSVIYVREGPHYAVTAEEHAILAGPRSERPTAAVCWMDMSAYALCDYCRDRSIRVPEELAIVGFDGVRATVRPERVLTTVCAPWVEVASLAVEQLLSLLDGNSLPNETVLPVELQVGDTA